jgi:hypothetical protein
MGRRGGGLVGRRGMTMRRIEAPSADAERREDAARGAGSPAERRGARRAERAREEIDFLAAGPAGYPFSRRV